MAGEEVQAMRNALDVRTIAALATAGMVVVLARPAPAHTRCTKARYALRAPGAGKGGAGRSQLSREGRCEARGAVGQSPREGRLSDRDRRRDRAGPGRRVRRDPGRDARAAPREPLIA